MTNLTENDIALLQQALTQLKGNEAEAILQDTIGQAIARSIKEKEDGASDEDVIEAFKTRLDVSEKELRARVRETVDNITVLQAKLIGIRRELNEQEATAAVNDLVNGG